jgi:hypothetical protein
LQVEVVEPSKELVVVPVDIGPLLAHQAVGHRQKPP